MIVLCLIVILMFRIPDLGYKRNIVEAIMVLEGFASPEDIPEERIEYYYFLYSKPIRINKLTKVELSSSSLMTDYQIASLLDYRQKYGDLLSVTELASLDGFGKEKAEALSLFVAFDSDRIPIKIHKHSINGKVEIKNGLKFINNTKQLLYNLGTKSRLSFKDKTEFGIAILKDYNNTPTPIKYSFTSIYNFDKFKIIAGDFNIRLGQGLVLWDGFTIKSFSGAASFYLRSTGLSPSLSYSGISNRGLAFEWIGERVSIIYFNSFPGLRQIMQGNKIDKIRYSSGLSASLLMNKGNIGINTYYNKYGNFISSIDSRFCLQGVDLFSELAYDFQKKGIKALLGMSLPINKTRISSHLRYYTGELFRCALGMEWRKFIMAVDYQYDLKRNYKFKTLLSYNQKINEKINMLFVFKNIYLSSDKNKFRTDLKTDIKYLYDFWHINYHLSLVKTNKLSFLTYIESGYDDSKWILWFRTTGFMVNDWNGRIYVYEKDAPGSFSVPAYVGSGYNLSFYSGYRLKISSNKRSIKFYFRIASYIYPKILNLNKKIKPGRTELKFQINYSF